MGKFTFQRQGKSYTVTAPAGTTQDQAKAIFDQQANTGSLDGLQPGDTLSAATQAAQGLDSAAANASQDLAKSGKSLAQGIGDLAGATVKAVKSVAGGIGKAVKGIGKGVSSGLAKVGSSLGSAVVKIGEVIGSVPIGNGITVGNFALSTAAFLGIGGMTQAETTGTLAQVSNNVNQPADAVSNSKGVGKYGLSISQLESAGYVRPGNSALVNATNTPVSILKSPAVWTGKDGINSLDDMLANEKIQSKIQQTTMVQGLAGLAAVGLAVGGGSDAITTAAMAVVAAKSIQQAAAYFKDKPIPNDPTGTVKTEFDNSVRNSAYAVSYTQQKVPEVWKAEENPVAAVATTNRDTVNAASTRIVGNDKVPEPQYNNAPPDVEVDATAVGERFTKEYNDTIDNFNNEIAGIKADPGLSKLQKLEARETVFIRYIAILTGLRQSIADYYYDRTQLKKQDREKYNFNGSVFYQIVLRIGEDIKAFEVKLFDTRDDLLKLKSQTQ
jgi:hypothetical protein